MAGAGTALLVNVALYDPHWLVTPRPVAGAGW